MWLRLPACSLYYVCIDLNIITRICGVCMNERARILEHVVHLVNTPLGIGYEAHMKIIRVLICAAYKKETALGQCTIYMTYNESR